MHNDINIYPTCGVYLCIKFRTILCINSRLGQPEGNNPLRVNNSDVYNPLKAITVLLYRTTDQGLGM
jgi:hypothetical protein